MEFAHTLRTVIEVRN